MKALIRAFALLSWLLIVCSSATAVAALSVVTTTTDLAAVAASIGKERVRVRALALHTQDPHWVDARPNLALELSNADLLLAVGAELEIGWLPTLQLGARNGRIQKGARGYLECAELVELLERPTGKVDRSMGDIHPSGNPHYMMDPRAVERVAVGIARRLAELDPPGRQRYLENAKAFVGELRQARTRWEQKLRKARGARVIAFHRSLAYLADWIGLDVVDHIESKPGVPPNPRHIAELIERAKSLRVRVVLQETFHPANTSELVVKKIGARLLVIPAAPNFSAGQGYVAFMDGIVNQLAGAL
ncbi:MAG TPA: metal ABC transporter substrate-binding protein [Polyangiaceae bacterium]